MSVFKQLKLDNIKLNLKRRWVSMAAILGLITVAAVPMNAQAGGIYIDLPGIHIGHSDHYKKKKYHRHYRKKYYNDRYYYSDRPRWRERRRYRDNRYYGGRYYNDDYYYSNRSSRYDRSRRYDRRGEYCPIRGY